MTLDAGQLITVDGFGQLLKLTSVPRKSDKESGVILDFCRAHVFEFSALQFAVPVGQGITPDPSHLPGVQATAKESTKKRIDILAWQGNQPWLVEAKYRLGPDALGQLHTYSLLWQRENPGARAPKLVAIGRYSDPDVLSVLYAHGVTVYLYPESASGGPDSHGAVPAVDAGAGS